MESDGTFKKVLFAYKMVDNKEYTDYLNHKTCLDKSICGILEYAFSDFILKYLKIILKIIYIKYQDIYQQNNVFCLQLSHRHSIGININSFKW